MRKRAVLLSLALATSFVITGCATQSMQPLSPRVFKMSNKAMAPTIEVGEIFVADIAAYHQGEPSRWDLVVFRPPHDPDSIWAFRVVGLPGEKIRFEDGDVVIDGEPLDRPDELQGVRYDALAADGAGGMDRYQYEVPEGQYYVLGDNARRANDSRVWGSVPRDHIMGRIADR